MNKSAVNPDFPSDLMQALADDGESLAVLHDRELTPDLIRKLKNVAFPRNMGMLPADSDAEAIWQMMAAAVEQLPAQPEIVDMDDLAADYAAIYLTGACGASPCESVWTDDDHLMCQESMFQLREIYEKTGLETADWRCRPEDHLVLQLHYIVHGLRSAANHEDWRFLAQVMDEHLLRWLPDFTGRVASRCTQPFYATLALLTDAWCDQTRDLLAALLEAPRPDKAEIEARLRPQQTAKTVIPLTYIPGVAPGW